MLVGIAQGMSAVVRGTYGLVGFPVEVLFWGDVSQDFPADECGRGGPTNWDQLQGWERCVVVMSVGIVRGMSAGEGNLRHGRTSGGDARIYFSKH